MEGELIILSNDSLVPSSPYVTELQKAYAAARKQVACNNAKLFAGHYRLPGCSFAYWRFYEAQQRLPALAAARGAAASQADRGFAAQRGRFFTVITIFAVSLFLIGLTLTVPASARKPFLSLGSLAGLAALAWGVVVLATPVKSPSQQAIAEFAAGAAALNTAQWETAARLPIPQVIATYNRAATSLTEAIALGDNGAESYIDRGDAYLVLDLLNTRGPQGSALARNDFARAVQLDPKNYVSWGNLGAARFWLGDYVGALNATTNAISIHTGDPVADMNVAVYNKVLGRNADYRRSLARLRQHFEHIPSWLRNAAVALYRTPIVDAETFRPRIATQVAAFDQDLHAIADSIAVSESEYGRPTSPPSPTKFRFLGYRAAGTELTVDFAFSGMNPKLKYLDYFYIDNVRLAPYGPMRWSRVLKGGPSAGTLPLNVGRRNKWPSGTHVLAEIFVEGNLRVAKEFVVG
jgi:tetratricopeptide (TPR) repeat protein